jgi:hypothetical protein
LRNFAFKLEIPGGTAVEKVWLTNILSM